MRQNLATTVFAAALLAGCAAQGPPKAYMDLWEKGTVQVRKEDFAAARSTFREVLTKHPGQAYNPYVELLLSDCEKRLGNETEARRLREKVAKTSTVPELKMQASAGLGRSALEKERFDEAAALFRDALGASKGAPSDELASLRCQLGMALQMGGNFAEGRVELKKAVELSPGSPAARLARIQLLYPDHFAVQTGAYKDGANAARQKDILAKKGFPAEVVVMDLPQGRRHCVRVGKLRDRAAAVALGGKIRAAKVLPEGSKIAVKP